MKLQNLLALILSISFVSCSTKRGGDYVAYKTLDRFTILNAISPISNIDESLDKQARSFFLGKVFTLTFHKDYIVLATQGSYKNIILNKDLYQYEVETFKGEKLISGTTVKFRLFQNDTNYYVLAIDLEVPEQKPLVVPTQLGGTASMEQPVLSRTILCLKPNE